MRSKTGNWRVWPKQAPADERARIVFVINSIGQGGAERALSHILEAGRALKDRFDIHLALLDDLPQAREMPDNVTIHVLNSKGRLLLGGIQLANLLMALRPHLVVSLLVRANILCSLLGRLSSLRVVVCERMHLSSHLAGRYQGSTLRYLSALIRFSYRGAAAVLGVSRGVTEDLVGHFGVAPGKASTIYNPYPLAWIIAQGEQPSEIPLPDRYIVAAGRLESAKNFELLIKAFVRADLSESLIILGDGAERGTLEALIRQSGACDRVFLAGYLKNPFPVVARATAFVSASRNEGFPNAMVEAMVLGRAIIATDCPSGPAEILEGSASAGYAATRAKYGILVPMDNIDATVEALGYLKDKALVEALGEAARLRAGDFSAPVINARYWDLFSSIARTTDKVALRDAAHV